uniref:ribonuclease H n=1 Tax=Panagrellus redivivus TaxID=6233 RepID=A0A7E4V9Y1_PANRE
MLRDQPVNPNWRQCAAKLHRCWRCVDATSFVFTQLLSMINGVRPWTTPTTATTPTCATAKGRTAADAVRKHLSLAHPHTTREPPRELGFTCHEEDCHQSFPSNAALRSHEKKHSKEKLDSVGAQLKAMAAIRKTKTVPPPKAMSPTMSPPKKRDVSAPSTPPSFRSPGKTYAEAVSPEAGPSKAKGRVIDRQEVIDISDDEADILLVKDTISKPLIDRLANPKEWIDDCIILELMKRRILRDSTDFIVVDPVIWNSRFKTPTKWSNVSDKKADVNLPTHPMHSNHWQTALIPTHINSSHWILAVVTHRPAKIVYYDTLHRKAPEATLSKWTAVGKLLTRKMLTPIAAPYTSYPRQSDGSSCGPLICMLSERIAAGESTLFDPKTVYEWRTQASRFLEVELGIALPQASNPAPAPREAPSSSTKTPRIPADGGISPGSSPAASDRLVSSSKQPQSAIARKSLIPVPISASGLPKATILAVSKPTLPLSHRSMSYYAVARGRNAGIYRNWDDCRNQVHGYSGARFKKFDTAAEASNFINDHGSGGGSRNFGGYSSYSSNPAPVVYTDGSCANNGYPNARGGIGIYWGEGHRNNLSAPLHDYRATNNRAEYKAVNEAVKQARRDGYDSVTIRTDSKLLVKSANEYSKNWRRNDWKTVRGKVVKNQDLLREYHQLKQTVNVTLQHVNGHRGRRGNEMADRLARAATRNHYY